MNKMLVICGISAAIVSLLMGACTKDADDSGTEDVVLDGSDNANDATAANGKDHELAADYIWDTNSVIPIVLNGTSVTENSDAVTVSGSVVTISSAGNYSFSGSLTNGRIVVNTTDQATVRLILNGVTINCSNNAAIDVEKASKVILILAENTKNTVIDGASYTSTGEDTPNAAIFSKADLTIYGKGALTVQGKYKDGITSKDGLIIKSGTIGVTAVDDGIRGKDYLVVKDGTITVTTTGDGLKSDNDSDKTLGYILVEAGTLVANSGGDAIAAQTDVIITKGNFNLTSGGGSSKTVTTDVSSKGIKGVVSVVIEAGTFTLNCSDDAIHSNGNVAINGGTFAITTGDDGIHGDTALKFEGGDVVISKSYEGIESKQITIDKGNIWITASDDGLNVAGGNDGSGAAGWGGQGMTTGNYNLYMNGGYVVINSVGDGVDVNGSVTMTGGTIVVSGPISNGNGPLDYDGSFKITGGFIAAAGSSGMAQAPGTSSTVNSLLVIFSSSQKAENLIHIQSSAGTDILTLSPAKAYQSLAFSSTDLKQGTTYDIYLGGSSSGTLKDGLYSGGTYSGGTKYSSFTVSGVVTKLGSNSGGGAPF